MQPPPEPATPAWNPWEPRTWLDGVDVSIVAARAAREVAPLMEPVAGLQTLLGEVPLVDADEEVLADVVLGLLYNATLSFDDWDPDVNAVFLTTTAVDGFVCIAVLHNGRAIENADAILALRTRYRPEHETGLELSRMTRLLEPFGGTITLRPVGERGCRIEVRLPAI